MKKSNKKVLNAKPLTYKGIKFKSRLEVLVYTGLIEAGFKPKYEPKTYVLWEGFKPTVPFYDVDKDTKLLKLNDKKIIDIKYTPDFRFEYKGLTIYVEAKGKENDVYYIKKKLFRNYLEHNEPKSMYFEIHTKKQLLQAINIIKST